MILENIQSLVQPVKTCKCRMVKLLLVRLVQLPSMIQSISHVFEPASPKWNQTVRWVSWWPIMRQLAEKTPKDPNTPCQKPPVLCFCRSASQQSVPWFSCPIHVPLSSNYTQRYQGSIRFITFSVHPGFPAPTLEVKLTHFKVRILKYSNHKCSHAVFAHKTIYLWVFAAALLLRNATKGCRRKHPQRWLHHKRGSKLKQRMASLVGWYPHRFCRPHPDFWVSACKGKYQTKNGNTQSHMKSWCITVTYWHVVKSSIRGPAEIWPRPQNYNYLKILCNIVKSRIPGTSFSMGIGSSGVMSGDSIRIKGIGSKRTKVLEMMPWGKCSKFPSTIPHISAKMTPQYVPQSLPWREFGVRRCQVLSERAKTTSDFGGPGNPGTFCFFGGGSPLDKFSRELHLVGAKGRVVLEAVI